MLTESRVFVSGWAFPFEYVLQHCDFCALLWDVMFSIRLKKRELLISYDFSPKFGIPIFHLNRSENITSETRRFIWFFLFLHFSIVCKALTIVPLRKRQSIGQGLCWLVFSVLLTGRNTAYEHHNHTLSTRTLLCYVHGRRPSSTTFSPLPVAVSGVRVLLLYFRACFSPIEWY